MPYRIIYSLIVELEPLPTDPPRQITEVLIPLDARGMSTVGRTRPRPPKTRAIDLREGDEILCRGRWRKIKTIKAYRDNWTDGPNAMGGYVYQVS